jgi:hypothetical protein
MMSLRRTITAKTGDKEAARMKFKRIFKKESTMKLKKISAVLFSLWLALAAITLPILPAQAAVTVQTPYIAHTANGTATTFAYPFRILKNTDLVVTVAGVQKTLTTDYTVTGVGESAGGTVVFGTAPATGLTVEIERSIPRDRVTDYQQAGPFFAKTVNADLDRITMQVQELGMDYDRSIKIKTPAGSANDTIDSDQYAIRAGKVFGYDTYGTLALLGVDLTTSSSTLANHWVDVRAYGSIEAALAAIGETVIELRVTDNQTLTSNVVVPSNVSLRIDHGGLVDLDGKNLTINSFFLAEDHQVFAGVGIISGLKETRPEWWAANISPGSTDMTTAVQSAVNAVSGGGEILLSGTYGVTTINLLNKNGITIRGTGTLKSLDGTKETIHITGCQDITLKDFTVYGRFETEGPIGMEHSIRVDPNLVGATQVNKNIIIDNLTFKHNPLLAIYLGGNDTTYGLLSDVRVTNCRMEYGLCFLMGVGIKNLLVDNIQIVHRTTAPPGTGISQDEDIAMFAGNGVSCENITINNVSIQAGGTTTNAYTGHPKLSFGISTAGLTFKNLLVNNISVKDNIGNFTPATGSGGSTLYVNDINADRNGFHNAQFSNINFYNSPGIFIQAHNLHFMNISLDTFPVIASFAGFGRAIDSSQTVSTAGCKFKNILIKDWNAGDPVMYTAEGGVEFNGLHIIGANGAVWASPNSVYNAMTLDNVGNSTHGSFWCQASLSPFVLSNLTIKNAPYTGLKDNIVSRSTGSVLSGARFLNNSVDTNVHGPYWWVYGILAAPSYVDNAAALAGGLVIGKWYYNTTTKIFEVVI